MLIYRQFADLGVVHIGKTWRSLLRPDGSTDERIQ